MNIRTKFFESVFNIGVSRMNRMKYDKIKEIIDSKFEPGEKRTSELFVFNDIEKSELIYYVCLELSAYQIVIVQKPDKPNCTITMTEDAFIKVRKGVSTFREQFEFGELDVDGEYWVRDFLIFDEVMDSYRTDESAVKAINE